MNNQNKNLQLIHSQSAEQATDNNRNHKVVNFLAPLALAATVFALTQGNNKNTVNTERAVPEATPATQVATYPREVITVEPGQGAEDVVREVDPGAIEGPKSSNAMKEGLEQFVKNQAPDHETLQPGDVAVPIVPGMQEVQK